MLIQRVEEKAKMKSDSRFHHLIHHLMQQGIQSIEILFSEAHSKQEVKGTSNKGNSKRHRGKKNVSLVKVSRKRMGNHHP